MAEWEAQKARRAEAELTAEMAARKERRQQAEAEAELLAQQKARQQQRAWPSLCPVHEPRLICDASPPRRNACLSRS